MAESNVWVTCEACGALTSNVTVHQQWHTDLTMKAAEQDAALADVRAAMAATDPPSPAGPTL